MARTVAELPKGSRITDYISLGVLNTMIPRTAVDAALEASSRQSIRQRDLPAHVMVYYVIALALYMQSSYREVLRCLLEGLQWLSDPSARPRVVGRSGISQARTRLGAEPLQALHDAVVRPVGRSSEPGCGYRRWHLVSIDGSGLDVADEQGNADAFGRPGASRGASAFPQIRFVSLVENGTHVLFGSRLAGCAVGELELIRFRGHLSSWRGGGVHNAEVETAVRGGIPTADGRAGSVRTYTGRVGSGVRAVGRGDTKLGRAGWSRRRRADRRPEHRRQRGVASTAPGEPASARRT